LKEERRIRGDERLELERLLSQANRGMEEERMRRVETEKELNRARSELQSRDTILLENRRAAS